MQVTTLLDAGQNPLAQTIRREIARVITQLELADVTGTPETKFAAFLAHAATVTPGYTNGPIDLTEVVVTNGATLNVENSAGNLDSAGTATVAGGVLTSVKLAATKTILTDALAVTGVTVTGTGTTATPTIVNGVLTAIALS